MTHSFRSSNASANCRIEWRPSRWLLAALALIAMLAVVAILASEMPRALAWPLCAVAVVGGAWTLRREAQRKPRELVFAGDGLLRIDDEPVTSVQVHWRGPLAFVQWKRGDGRVERLSFWPDTLLPAQRRELRLAVKPGLDPGLHRDDEKKR
jgi:toxin CptA